MLQYFAQPDRPGAASGDRAQVEAVELVESRERRVSRAEQVQRARGRDPAVLRLVRRHRDHGRLGDPVRRAEGRVLDGPRARRPELERRRLLSWRHLRGRRPAATAIRRRRVARARATATRHEQDRHQRAEPDHPASRHPFSGARPVPPAGARVPSGRVASRGPRATARIARCGAATGVARVGTALPRARQFLGRARRSSRRARERSLECDRASMPAREGTGRNALARSVLGWRAMTPLRVNLPPRVPLARLPTPLEPLAAPRRGARRSSSSTSATTSPASSSPATRRASSSSCSPRRRRTAPTRSSPAAARSRTTAARPRSRPRSAASRRCVAPAGAGSGAAAGAEANILLDRLAGAELRWVSHDEYRRRARGHGRGGRASCARPGGAPTSSPRAARTRSAASATWLAVAELARAAARRRGASGPATIAYALRLRRHRRGASSSGVRLARMDGARARSGSTSATTRAYFQDAIGRICAEARRRWPSSPRSAPRRSRVDDGFVGPGYARARPTRGSS